MTNLYEADYWAWTQQQAEALRKRSGNELDWDLLAQELDALGATEERELRSRTRKRRSLAPTRTHAGRPQPNRP